MVKKLYIIGNGFDIHHDIDSRYSAFREYCKKEDNDLYIKLEKYYYDSDMLWSNFEMGLAHINPDSIMDYARLLNNEWDTSFKGMYAFVDEVKDEVDFLQISLKRCFREWVEQLKKANNDKQLLFDKENALFMSFNYTDTLEYLYKIPQKNRILYIHGKAEDQFSQLIFGHPFSHEELEGMMPDDNGLEDEAIDEIVDYLNELNKDTDSIIAKNEDFFQAISNVENIYLLGHSMAKVDYPYFEKISNSTSDNASWVISYFCKDDIVNAENLMQKINISSDRYKLIKLDQLDSEFMPKLVF